jgi:hypothetical protein
MSATASCTSKGRSPRKIRRTRSGTRSKPSRRGSAIAKEHLGSAGSYMKIFELNKDHLTDPDKIKPGQVLRLP